MFGLFESTRVQRHKSIDGEVLNLESRVYTFGTMANDDGCWVRTVVDELRRPGRVPRFSPMPADVRVRMNKTLGALWPLAQSSRDDVVFRVAQMISGVRGPPPRPHAFTPEPEASRIAVAAEAEGFAAASAYAAGKSVATDEERSDLYRKYVKEVWGSVHRYVASRPQAAGTSRSVPSASAPAAPVE